MIVTGNDQFFWYISRNGKKFERVGLTSRPTPKEIFSGKLHFVYKSNQTISLNYFLNTKDGEYLHRLDGPAQKNYNIIKTRNENSVWATYAVGGCGLEYLSTHFIDKEEIESILPGSLIKIDSIFLILEKGKLGKSNHQWIKYMRKTGEIFWLGLNSDNDSPIPEPEPMSDLEFEYYNNFLEAIEIKK